MAKPLIGLILGATASFSLSGCSANAGGETEPALASESICLASRSFQRCQFEHYLAGGYPIRSDRGPGR